MMTSIDENGKITLWTSQSKIVLNTINEKGIYHVKREFIEKKYADVANVFLEVYTWFISKAEQLLPRPSGAEFPIWLFTDPKYIDHHKDYCILEIRVDRHKTLLFDQMKWNRILNFSYIPKDEKDAREFIAALARYGIYNETDVYMKNYYPHLKIMIKKSWDRLFDHNIILSESKQASLWEIRKEWIKNIYE